MSDQKSFADQYALKIMALGFILVAIGAVSNFATQASWTMPLAGTGLVVYLIGRILQFTRKKN